MNKMKLKLTITFLIVVLTIGSIIIVTDFIFNSKYIEIPIISNPYENLQKYANELEKINEYNQEILKDLEYQIKNSDDVNISQINDEIDIINNVINQNKLELEEILTKLCEIESNP